MAIKDARMFVSESQLETKYYIRLAKTNCKKKNPTNIKCGVNKKE